MKIKLQNMEAHLYWQHELISPMKPIVRLQFRGEEAVMTNERNRVPDAGPRVFTKLKQHE